MPVLAWDVVQSVGKAGTYIILESLNHGIYLSLVEALVDIISEYHDSLSLSLYTSVQWCLSLPYFTYWRMLMLRSSLRLPSVIFTSRSGMWRHFRSEDMTPGLLERGVEMILLNDEGLPRVL